MAERENDEGKLSKAEKRALEKEKRRLLKEQKREERGRRKREKRQRGAKIAPEEKLPEEPGGEVMPGKPTLGESREGIPIPDNALHGEGSGLLSVPVIQEESKPAGLMGEEGEERASWFSRLKKGLSKSRSSWINPLSRALASRRFDEEFWEEVEDILVGADVGVEMTAILVERLRGRIASERIREPGEALEAFREEVARVLETEGRELRFNPAGTGVFLVVGVNGTGKTTTIAKLAYMFKKEGKKIILAAGDTFRAAGIEQLEIWGERVGVPTVKHRPGSDAAAVAFDAIQSAKARGVDVVIVDTAGRLHTKVNLMEELKKIKRVAEREAPVTESLLVIDATTGQNGLIQARLFKDAIDITGVILTKMDGTAKGGIVIAIQHDLGIPIKLIGVGEDLEDLHPFDPEEFSQALFSQ